MCYFPDPVSGQDYYGDALSQGCADILRDYRKNIPDKVIREFIEKALKIGRVKTRKTFYQLGLDLFGLEYLELAGQDNAKSIRDWADKQTRKIS